MITNVEGSQCCGSAGEATAWIPLSPQPTQAPASLLAAPLFTQLPTNVLAKQQKVIQVFGHLPCLWKTQKKVPGLRLAGAGICGMHQQMGDFSLSVSSAFSVTPILKQINHSKMESIYVFNNSLFIVISKSTFYMYWIDKE